MSNELFPIYVVGWASIVIVVMLTWVFLIWCGDEMRDAWGAMEDREWRWPEGTNGVYGPGDEPVHWRKK
jgi:hypothetical protein